MDVAHEERSSNSAKKISREQKMRMKKMKTLRKVKRKWNNRNRKR